MIDETNYKVVDLGARGKRIVLKRQLTQAAVDELEAGPFDSVVLSYGKWNDLSFLKDQAPMAI
jgi:hypothetical protein